MSSNRTTAQSVLPSLLSFTFSFHHYKQRIFCFFFLSSWVSDPLSLLYSLLLLFTLTLHFGLFFLSPVPLPFPSQSLSSILLLTLGLFRPSLSVSLSLDGFRLLSWWGWWPVWRLGCLVSPVIREDVALRGRSELSASASPRVTFHGQLVSEQRHARRLSAPLIVKINGNQSLLTALHSLLRSFHISASNPHSRFPLSLFVASLSLWVFPWCAFAALWLMAGIWQYVIRLFSPCFIIHFDIFATSPELKPYNAMKTVQNLMFLFLLFAHYLIHFLFSLADCAGCSLFSSQGLFLLFYSHQSVGISKSKVSIITSDPILSHKILQTTTFKIPNLFVHVILMPHSLRSGQVCWRLVAARAW